MSNEMTQMDRKSRIRRCLPIQACGLNFYPIRMTNYEDFLDCKNVLAIRMTSLAKTNFEYLSMPFLSAMWAIEIDSLQATGKSIGMFERILKLLYLSLRLGYDFQKASQGVYCDKNNPRILSHIEVVQNDGKSIKISPMDFTTIIRPLIAEQNGIELPDESENPDIIETEIQMQQDSQKILEINIESLIASVASNAGIRECDIDEWTIVEFERRKQAIERKLNYVIYTQAEMSGMVKFNDGNPYPSWCFDRTKSLTNALITVDEMQDKYKGLGDLKQTLQQESLTN